MKVIFRVDASLYVGSGHVMRCLVLAEELKNRGHDITFMCRELEGNLIEFIRNAEFQVIKLKKVETIKPKASDDYLSWLQVSIVEDAKEVISNMLECDVIVTDHYALDSKWEDIVRPKLNCNIVAIDDLNRPHVADLIVDQNYWPDMTSRYSQCKGKRLLGPNYALLRPKFRALKSDKMEKKDRVIAFFGGADPTGECLKLLSAARSFEALPFNIFILAGVINPWKEQLLEYSSPFVEIQTHTNDFEYELKKSKYAIGASGVSNWERFCLELPTTIVSVAKNQESLSEYLSQMNAVRYLGRGSQTSVNTYITEIEYLIHNWNNIRYEGVINVDGFGALRVAKEIERINDEV